MTWYAHEDPAVAFLDSDWPLSGVAVEIEDGKGGEEPGRLVRIVCWIHAR